MDMEINGDTGGLEKNTHGGSYHNDSFQLFHDVRISPRDRLPVINYFSSAQLPAVEKSGLTEKVYI